MLFGSLKLGFGLKGLGLWFGEFSGFGVSVIQVFNFSGLRLFVWGVRVWALF